jgi:hypothetical protein
MKKYLLIYVPLGIIFLVSGFVFYFQFSDHFVQTFNRLFPQELIPPSKNYSDLSPSKPNDVPQELVSPTKDYNDLSASKLYVIPPKQPGYDIGDYSSHSRIYESAQKGFSASSIDQCQDNAYCIGGYAAKTKDQSPCETHDFESKYYWYSGCANCGNTRNKSGNSKYENCYIGFGVVNKDQNTCINLPKPLDLKNAPEYRDDKSSISKIKKESCLYGVAVGKANIEACETTGFFVETCKNGFSATTR